MATPWWRMGASLSSNLRAAPKIPLQLLRPILPLPTARHARFLSASPCSTKSAAGNKVAGPVKEKDCTPCESTCTVTIPSDMKCWQCHCARRPARCAETLFCKSCGHIQPPAPSCNYFELMGLSSEDERFDLDLKKLEQNYKRLMSKLHPDRFMTKREREIEFSQAQCSTVNVAYSTLRCPFRRAKYMLRRMGVDFEEGTSATDPEFIMEILEASCEIEDANRDQKKLAQVRDGFYAPNMTSCGLDFATAYSTGDTTRAAAATARLQYLKRVQEQLRDVVDLV